MILYLKKTLNFSLLKPKIKFGNFFYMQGRGRLLLTLQKNRLLHQYALLFSFLCILIIVCLLQAKFHPSFFSSPIQTVVIFFSSEVFIYLIYFYWTSNCFQVSSLFDFDNLEIFLYTAQRQRQIAIDTSEELPFTSVCLALLLPVCLNHVLLIVELVGLFFKTS